MERNRPSVGDRRRLEDCGTTLWGELKGVQGFLYLAEHYGPAIRGVIEGRIARGDFPPLRVERDADDAFQDLIVRLQRTRWLERYPQEDRGRFRPYLYDRIGKFLAERRRKASTERRRGVLSLDQDEVPEPAVEDPIYREFDSRCLRAEVSACLRDLGRFDALAEQILRHHLADPVPPRDVIARSLRLSVDRYRRSLTDARRRFRELWEGRGGNPDQVSSLSDESRDERS